MEKSETIGNLAMALVNVQSELRPAEENAVNPFLRNRYADLGSVWDSCRALLAANELSVAQFPTSPPNDAGAVGLTTVLMHSSGEWMADTVYLPVMDEKGKSLAQVAGSIISYLRRYGLSAVLGITTGEDDDGSMGGSPPERKPRPTKKRTQPPSNGNHPPSVAETGTSPRTAAETKVALIAASQDGANEPASEKQLKFARSTISDLVGGDADKARLLLFHIFGIESSANLTSAQASAFIDWGGKSADNDWQVSAIAKQEANHLLRAFEIKRGQGEGRPEH